MSVFGAMDVSATGMTAQQTRMDTISENIYPNCVDFLAFIAQCDTLLLDYIYSEQGVRSYGSFGLSSKKHGKDHIAGADE